MSEASPKVILDVKDISLSFGGVKAITDVSFDVRLGEVRAIIGPNGAGKTSMLNCINGFYHPQVGTISYKGEPRKRMAPYVAASQGIARTFQNVALFRGMTTLDNIMSGRTLRMKKNFFWQMWRHGPAMQEEIEHRQEPGRQRAALVNDQPPHADTVFEQLIPVHFFLVVFGTRCCLVGWDAAPGVYGGSFD